MVGRGLYSKVLCEWCGDQSEEEEEELTVDESTM